MTKPYVLNRKSSLWRFCIDSAFTVGWLSVVCSSSSWLWLYQPSGQTTFYQKLYLYILGILDTGWSSPVKTGPSSNTVEFILCNIVTGLSICTYHFCACATLSTGQNVFCNTLIKVEPWEMMLTALSAVLHSCVYFALVVFSHLFSSFHLPECVCNLITLISMNPELHFDCMFRSFLAAQRSWPSALNDIWYLCWRTEFVSNF